MIADLTLLLYHDGHCTLLRPSLMAEATTQGANCTSGAIFGVQYLAQGYFDMQLSSALGELGFEPATFRSLATCSTH